MVADVEELETLDASEIYARSFNAKEITTPKNDELFEIPDRRWNSQIVWRRSGFPKNPRSSLHEAKTITMIFEDHRTGLNRKT